MDKNTNMQNMFKIYDLIIIGGGPAGLAAGYKASQCGFSYLILEKDMIAQTIYNYPIGKTLFSTPNEIELIPGTLRPKDTKPTREEVLDYYNRFALRDHSLNISMREQVRGISRTQEGFSVMTDKGKYKSLFVLMATGGFNIPRRLNVPGETKNKVSYRFVEAYQYAGKNVLVVGGGNSAAEAALYLHEGGARVWLSLRRPGLEPLPGIKNKIGIKPWVMEPLEKLDADGEIKILYSSKVVKILQNAVLLETEGNEGNLWLPCNHVFALLGADPDTSLLKSAGVEIAQDGRPVYNTQTYETNIHKLYVAGHLTREMHMKNAIDIPPKIIERIAVNYGEALKSRKLIEDQEKIVSF